MWMKPESQQNPDILNPQLFARPVHYWSLAKPEIWESTHPSFFHCWHIQLAPYIYQAEANRDPHRPYKRAASANMTTTRSTSIPTLGTIVPLGREGYWSGSGSTHSSPLKSMRCGNAQPLASVNKESFRNKISDWTFPSGPPCISISL